jgi:WD40 repeat protein
VPETGSDCALVLPDGATVASEQGATVVLINIKDPSHRKQLKLHTKRVHALAASDKGDLLACASEDGTVSVWDVAKAEVLHTFPVNRYALGVAFAADGQRLAAAGFDGDYTVWDGQSGRPADLHAGWKRSDRLAPWW